MGYGVAFSIEANAGSGCRSPDGTGPGASLLPSGSGAGSLPAMRAAARIYPMACSLRSIITGIVQRQAFDSDYVQRLAHSDEETERDFSVYFGDLLAIKLRSRLRSA